VSTPKDDPIAEITDPFTRAAARVAVHVRRFLTFYAGGLGFVVAMLMVPVVHGGGGGTPASVAGPGGVAGAAGASNPAVAAPGRKAATPAGAAAATSSSTSFAASELDDAALRDGGAAGAAVLGGTGAAIGDGTTSALPDSPFGDTADIPATPDAPELCRLEPPSPAPAVSPERELSGLQDTVEAVAQQQLPVDSGATIAPVTQQALCATPALPVAPPSVPLPATPVAASSSAGATPLQRLVGLLFG
jgi:hypothetical protein